MPSGNVRLMATSRLALMVASCGLSMSFAGVVQAQDAKPGASASETGLTEIVVTAQRREEPLQKTPIAITAFDEDALAKSNLFDAQALQQQAPGLEFGNQSFGAGPQVGIRGVSSVNVSVGGEQGVQFVKDGVVLGRPGNAAAQFYDLERVEVLRGPQGTLFGRNANAGVISIITARPENEFSASADGLYGNFNHVRLTGTLNLPLASNLAVRASGLYEDRDGYSTNLFNRKDAEDLTNWAGRISLKWDPTSDLEVLLIADTLSSKNHGGLFHHMSAILDAQGRPYVPAGGGSGIPVDYYVPTSTREVNFNVPELNRTKSTIYNATITWHGPIDVKSITGYGRNRFSALNDVDASNYDVAFINRVDRGKQFSQELQFLSNDSTSPLKWVAGLFYYQQDDTLNSPYQANPTVLLNVTGGVHQKSYAAYGQLSYNVTPELKLTAGLRYTEDHKHAFEYTTLQLLLPPEICGLVGIPGCVAPFADFKYKNKWHALTPRVAIDYQVTPDILVYASATRGYQAGGYNIGASQPAYDPEYIWAYEAGVKSRFFRDKLQVNLSAFHYDYKNLITSHFRFNGSAGFTVLDNAGAAKVDGAELEVTAIPVPRLRLSGSVAYLHARYTEYEAVNSQTCPVPDPSLPGCQPLDLSGNTLPRAPKWTLSGSASYDIPMGPGVLTLTVEDYWQASRAQFSYFNFPLTSQGPYHRTNVRARYAVGDWSIEAFGENLQNKRRLNNTYGDSSVETYGLYGAPRTYGVRAIVKFK